MSADDGSPTWLPWRTGVARGEQRQHHAGDQVGAGHAGAVAERDGQGEQGDDDVHRATPARTKNAMSAVPIAPRSSCLGSGAQQTMLNFGVRNLDAMLAIGEPGKAHQGCVFLLAFRRLR